LFFDDSRKQIVNQASTQLTSVMVKLVLAVLAAGVSAAAPFKEANEVRSLIRFDKATPDAWAPMRSLLSNEIFLIAQMSKTQRLAMKRQTWAWAKAKKVNQRETWAWASAKKAGSDPYANAADMDEAAVREKFAPACADTLESIAENMLAHTPDRQFTESPELLGLSLSTHLQVICQTLPIPEDDCDAAATQLYRLVAAGHPLGSEPAPEEEKPATYEKPEPGCEKCPARCKSEEDALVAACAPCDTCPRVNPCAPVCPVDQCGTKADKLWLSSSFGIPACAKCSACYYPDTAVEEELSKHEIEGMTDILHHIGHKLGWGQKQKEKQSLLQLRARSAPLPLGEPPAEPEVPADGVEWCGSFFDLFFSAVLEKMAKEGKGFLQQ
jgi:hypothetical protein